MILAAKNLKKSMELDANFIDTSIKENFCLANFSKAFKLTRKVGIQ